jgi:hypothetical protein
MVEYIPCYSAPALHWGLLPATRLASRIILIEQNIKRTGPALCVLCEHTPPIHNSTAGTLWHAVHIYFCSAYVLLHKYSLQCSRYTGAYSADIFLYYHSQGTPPVHQVHMCIVQMYSCTSIRQVLTTVHQVRCTVACDTHN